MEYKLRLREILKDKGMTQKALAEKLNETERVVGTWVRCDKPISLEDAYRVCMVLNCTPNDLCGWYLDHPHDANGQTLTNEETELVEHYRECTPQWKQAIAMNARGCAGESKKETQCSIPAANERKAI